MKRVIPCGISCGALLHGLSSSSPLDLHRWSSPSQRARLRRSWCVVAPTGNLRRLGSRLPGGHVVALGCDKHRVAAGATPRYRAVRRLLTEFRRDLYGSERSSGLADTLFGGSGPQRVSVAARGLAFPHKAGQNDVDSATGRVCVTESDQAAREAPFTAVRLARRDLFPLIGAAALATFAAPATTGAELEVAQQAQDDTQAVPSRYVYVGTYTGPNTAPGGQRPSTSRGIYVFKMDGGSGSLSPVQVFEVENPRGSASTRTRHTCMPPARSQAGTEPATRAGSPPSRSTRRAGGSLHSAIRQPAGSIPAHVVLDPSGKFALVANYIGANWSVLPVGANGALGAASDVWAATGRGPNMLARMPASTRNNVRSRWPNSCSVQTSEPITSGPGSSTPRPARWCQTRASMPPRSLRVRARGTCPSIRAANPRMPSAKWCRRLLPTGTTPNTEP